MHHYASCLKISILCIIVSGLSACATNQDGGNYFDVTVTREYKPYNPDNYTNRIPKNIAALGEKVVIVNPSAHTWAAYDPAGKLVRGGLATSGSDWCEDMGRPCHTDVGSFRVRSLGTITCKSKEFPVPDGGAPMPYCMFFNQGEALHGVPDYEVVDGNASHGCVRMHVEDAKWLRFNFVNIGTKVIIKSYGYTEREALSTF